MFFDIFETRRFCRWILAGKIYTRNAGRLERLETNILRTVLAALKITTKFLHIILLEEIIWIWFLKTFWGPLQISLDIKLWLVPLSHISRKRELEMMSYVFRRMSSAAACRIFWSMPSWDQKNLEPPMYRTFYVLSMQLGMALSRLLVPVPTVSFSINNFASFSFILKGPFSQEFQSFWLPLLWTNGLEFFFSSKLNFNFSPIYFTHFDITRHLAEQVVCREGFLFLPCNN